MELIISSSCGNDSVALIQWAIENKLKNVTVVYLNTGWAAPFWPSRVEKVSEWARSFGLSFVEVKSIGMTQLVKDREAFPANRYQFCTAILKGIPFLQWIDEFDPAEKACVIIGKRRAESRARAETPHYIVHSQYHGGRTVWHPLYKHSHEERDALLGRAGFGVLPHRSRECSPCVNANKADFLALDPSQIQKVSELEVAIGKPMFRPKRFHAVGIHGVITWAKYGKKKMRTDPDEVESGAGCEGHFGCGL